MDIPTTQPVLSETVEVLEKPKPSLKDRTRNCCKRFWPLFLLLASLLLLIIILPLIFVAYPRAARRAVHDSRVNVTYMAILDPTPESVELTVVERLWTNSSHHPTLLPFNASLYLLNDPKSPAFATIQTNATEARNNQSVLVGPKRIKITDPGEFQKFVLLVAASEEFSYALRGHGHVKESHLPKVHVDYDKKITMKGLNGLKSFSILSMNMLDTAKKDGTNALGVASILNPSVMTIALGNVTLSLSVNGTIIGTATLSNLVLQPGNNKVNMRLTVYERVIIGIAMQKQQSVLPVDIRGNTSTFEGRQIPYYSKMLAAMQIRISLDLSMVMGKKASDSRRE